MTENKRYRIDDGDLWDSITGEMLMIDCDEAYYNIVDLLNEQHEQIERLKRNFKALDEVKCEIAEENERLKQQKDKWKQQCIHFKEMLDDMDIAYLCDEWIYEELKGDVE